MQTNAWCSVAVRHRLVDIIPNVTHSTPTLPGDIPIDDRQIWYGYGSKIGIPSIGWLYFKLRAPRSWILNHTHMIIPFKLLHSGMSGVVSGEKRAEVRVAFCHFTRREGSVAFTNGHNHGSLTTACYNHKIKRPSVMITATFWVGILEFLWNLKKKCPKIGWLIMVDHQVTHESCCI